MHIDTGVAVFMFGNKKSLTDPSKIIVAPGCWEEFVLVRDNGNIIIPFGSNWFMARNIFDEIKANVDKI